MPMEKSIIDPGKPGLYEVHLLYTYPRTKVIHYTVILLTTHLFSRAYELALIQLRISEGINKGKTLRVVDNLINLVTDPEAYLTT